MINELEDITPEGCDVPVFLDTTPIQPIIDKPTLSLDEIIANDKRAKETAIKEIITTLGLSEATARLMVTTQ